VIREGESVWVRTDSIVHTRLDRDAEFSPDAIRTTDEKWIGETSGLEVKDTTEASNLCIRAGTTR